MTDSFKEGFWYRFNGKAKSVYIDTDGDIHVKPQEEFMLDGKWHQCKGVGYYYWNIYFYDSPKPDEYCIFGDRRKPAGEKLYMFDEMSPAMYNIKKLKEIRNDRQF